MSKPVPVTTLTVLTTLVLVGSLWVVHNKQSHRRSVTERDQQRAVHQQLEQEWAQLQLEEASLASHVRVERVAREKRGMTEPALPVVIESEVRP